MMADEVALLVTVLDGHLVAESRLVQHITSVTQRVLCLGQLVLGLHQLLLCLLKQLSHLKDNRSVSFYMFPIQSQSFLASKEI